MGDFVQLIQRARRVGLRSVGLAIIGTASMVIVACGGSDEEVVPATSELDPPTSVASAPEPSEAPASTPEPIAIDPGLEPATAGGNQVTAKPTATLQPPLHIEDEVERSRAERLRTLWGWNTDLNERTISLTELEIVLPRDRITPIDQPTFASVGEAPDYMAPREPVVAVIVNGDARAYPLAILMWHEIVNDNIGDVPVTVTFCPLCNTVITFERVIDGRTLTFGTSGMLRRSDLVMWDRQTESFWQQITGEALAGEYAANATILKQIPSSIIAWETFVEAYPEGKLLRRVEDEFGNFARQYDNPPYAGYDNVDDQPFLFKGSIDDRLVATSRVLTIDGENPVAYPFAFLEESPVVNDSVGDDDIVAFFDNDTFSVFNDRLNERQTAGSVAVFSRSVDGRNLKFERTEAGITDIQTGSKWN
jgi:hypothetical protein